MTVDRLIQELSLETLHLADKSRLVEGGYCGDLLSWVMGRARSGNAWVTIMTNVNVVAVAALTDVSCVVFAGEEFTGLCFVNLVDFDMLYGHRRNPDGYAAALTEFDAWLANFLPRLKAGDILMITADHGCDPGKTDSTDHTREYVPLIAFGEGVRPGNLGTRDCFADIAATVCEYFGVKLDTPGKSFLKEML